MQKYDVALKLLLQNSGALLMRDLTGFESIKWLNVELPESQNKRVDLLGEHGDALVHIELQSGNDEDMPQRMAEYYLRVWRKLKRFPRQTVLYVGEPPVRMAPRRIGPSMALRYSVVDIRNLDGDKLIESGDLGDNVIAILAGLRNPEQAVGRIIASIANLPPGRREQALRLLLVLAGLRRMEDLIEREVSKVPLIIDIMDNQVLGREFKKGLEQGLEQGLERGREQGLEQGREQGLEQGLERGLRAGLQKGVHEGELAVLRRILRKRFGPMPVWANKHLKQRSAAELKEISERVLEAASLEDLFQ